MKTQWGKWLLNGLKRPISVGGGEGGIQSFKVSDFRRTCNSTFPRDFGASLGFGASCLGFGYFLRVSLGRKQAGLRFAIAVQEKRIIRNGFFDQLLEQKQFRAVDHGMDAKLESLHRRERLE